ncbi:baseplate J/gp47 family protein [Entomobacter blattae]|uniref:Baseplate J-like protein n=1 Tax=Entomobacter blattae TaxID=2762277 RepID=A0A7H1NU35_9PROT|nr:baseplate J/gp47 family protein [Entomobacter blattae]QNT79295.1 Baseplate J-like protein [Entomobacter blattae]
MSVSDEQKKALAAVTPTTSVPVPLFTDRGLQTPDEVDVLTGVITDINGAFGNVLAFFNADNRFLLARPQGQLATTQTAILNDCFGLLQYYVNGVDPTVADGKMQDGIGKIYFLYRKAAQSTVVKCLCRGAGGTVIQQGSRAKDVAGNIYAATETRTISPATSTVEIEFAAEQTGPIECPADTLTQIFQIIPGWDSITNEQDGITGQNVESRDQFEARRREATAHNAVNSLSAITGTLRQMDGVLDAYVTDNPSGAAVTKGGVELKPHSLYVCVAGGDDTAIARAIWNKKPPGCDMTGDTTITIEDTQNGYAEPLPTYDITFQKAKPVSISVRVDMARSPGQPVDAEARVKQAVLANFNGEDGSARLRIGSVVYASRFYAGIQALGAWSNPTLITVSRDGTNFAISVGVGIDEIPTLTDAHILVNFQ